MDASSISSSQAELEAELIQLYSDLEAKDNQIQKLEEELTEADNTNNASSRSSSSSKKVVKALQKQLDERDGVISDLEQQLQQAQIDQKLLEQQKTNLEKKVAAQKEKLGKQKERLQASKMQSEEAGKLQKEQSNDQYQLELENKELRGTIKELEKNEADLVAEVEALSNEKVELEQTIDAVEKGKNELQHEFDAYVNERADEEGECVELEQRLRSALDENKHMQEDLEATQEAYESEIASLEADLEDARKECKAIEEKSARSHGAQKQRSLQNEIDNLRREMKRAYEELKRSSKEKAQVNSDLEAAQQALIDAENQCQSDIQDAIAKERVNAKELEVRLDAAAEKEKEMLEAQADLQRQKNETESQLCRCEERNSWYEEGHGLADAVRYQRRLEADMHRRDHDLRQVQNRLNDETSRCQVLQATVVLLKEKAEVVDDPMFEEDAVKDAMATHDNQLEAQNTELSRQIERLEAERLSMMKQLRHNAAEIGDKGIKFLGLDAAQIQKVMEFASNIRDGTVALPLDDRSRELQNELQTIKADRETDKVTIERLERDIIGLRGCDADQVKASAQVQELQQSLVGAQDQKKQLQDEVAALREDAAKSEAAHQADYKDVLPTSTRERAQQILGKPLEDMPSSAQVQFLCLMDKYDAVSNGLSSIQESMRNNQDDVGQDNGLSNATANINQQILEQKMAILNLSSNSPLYMTSELTDALEKLSHRERDISAKNDLLQQYEAEIKTMREQVATLYNDHIKQQEEQDESVKDEQQQKQLRKEKSMVTQQPQKDGADSTSGGKPTDKEIDPPRLSSPKDLPIPSKGDSPSQLQLLQSELKSVKESAQGRMAQLKALLDEKNAAIERYRSKLMTEERMGPTASTPASTLSRPDSDCSYVSKESSASTVAKLRQAVKSVDFDDDSQAGSKARISLVKQVDALAALVRDKEARIYRLETKLRSTEEARVTSEKRCSNAILEIDRIKGDMQSLAHLVDTSEGRMAEASVAKKQACILQDQLEEKEEQIQRMSVQLSKLKARCGSNSADTHGTSQNLINEAKIAQLTEEVMKVKRQLSSSRLAKRKCDEELEECKKQCANAAEEVERMEKEVNKLKQVAMDARLDKENASSKARSAVTKLKEIQQAEDTKAQELERVKELETKVASLLRKNASLRGQLATKDSTEKADSSRPRPVTANADSTAKDQGAMLQKRLNERQAECKKLQKDLDSMRKTRQKERTLVKDLQSSLQTLEDENAQLLREKKEVFNKSSKEEDLHTELRRLHDEVVSLKKSKSDSSSQQHLKDDLARSEREKESISEKLKTVSLAEQRLQSKIVNLESEKAMLQRELHAFDLSFFEEIEDCKYRLSEALKENQSLRQQHGTTTPKGAVYTTSNEPWADLLYGT